MSMGVHQPYHLDLCADDEDPSQLIIRPGWDAPHVRCFPMTFCAWPCLLRQVGTVLGSPYDYVVAGLAYANPGSRQYIYLCSSFKFCSFNNNSGIVDLLSRIRQRHECECRASVAFYVLLTPVDAKATN